MSAVRAEFSKLWSLPSLWGVALAATLAPGLLAFFTSMANTASRANVPVELLGFEVAGFGQPLVVLFAALVVGSDYSGSQLRTTLLATPRRARVWGAKLVVVSGCAAIIAITAMVLALMFARMAVPHDRMFTAATWMNIGGVALNYTLMALLAAGITFLARTPLVAVIVLVPMVLGLTISLMTVLPVLRYLPDLAGMQLMLRYPGMPLLEPAVGALVMGAWAVAAVGAAAIVFQRSDVGA